MTATKHVMVIGGGITGLSAAFHLSRILPAVRITLLESRPRLGGWIKSDRLELEDERGERGSVVLESGPRTLRPNSGALLELRTGSEEQIHIFSPLTLLPSSLLGALATPFNPLLRPLLPAILGEPLRRANRPPKAEDESVNSFFTRRFGVDFARRFGSALVHGIYAADSRELSVRSAFPALWAAEELGRGSVVLGMRAAGRVLAEDMSGYDMGDVGQMMRNVSVYSFKEGMETLPRAMEAELATRANVRIIKGTGVVSVYAEEEDFKVRASRELPEDCPTHIISALPFQSLPEILPDPGLHFLIPHSHYSSVLLLNLVFPRFPHPAGFGYLVPRPEGGYSEVTEDNPGILGTVFDSVALGEQDTLPGAVKMTMMSGGPYKRRFGEPYLPEFLAALRQHLGIPVPDPLYHRFVVAKKCIPTPGMEHSARVAQLRHALLERPYAGRLEMIGAEAGGVSVGDCVRQGKEAALRIAQSVRG